MKTYKWKKDYVLQNLVIDSLSKEYIKNDILDFETNFINENQDGVDEATRKLSNI